MDQKIINLYDRFTHGAMARREFLDRLAQLAGSTAAAAALLPLLQNDYAQAAIVADNDPRLKAERRQLRFAEGQDQRLPGARHGRRQASGRDRRSTRTAGSIRTSRTSRAGSRSKATSRLRRICFRSPAARRRPRTRRAICTPRPTRTTCWRRRCAAVPFLQDACGIDRQGRRGRLLLWRRRGQPAGRRQPGPRGGGAVLRHPAAGRSGSGDPRARCCCSTPRPTSNINKGIAAYEAALKANNKTYTLHIYPGTQHAFNNDTGAARYNKAAADLAWSRTLAFFAQHLGAPPKGA